MTDALTDAHSATSSSTGAPLRHHRDDRSRRRPASGRHLVHGRRRRPRHQQRRRAPLADEPAARPADRIAVIDRDDGYRWVGLTGTVEPIADQATAQADIAAMARRYHADEPDEAERLIPTGSSAGADQLPDPAAPSTTISTTHGGDDDALRAPALVAADRLAGLPRRRPRGRGRRLGLGLDVGPPAGDLRSVGAAHLRGLERPGRPRRR